jgi:nucleotide-binding universal stress UspA family protein
MMAPNMRQDARACFGPCTTESIRAAQDSVEEIDYMPEYIEEVRMKKDTAARRFHKAVERAKAMAEQSQVTLQSHVVTGHPVRDVVKLAEELKADLLVIGAGSHSPVYERLVGSRADRIVQLAPYPVLVVK